MNYIKSCFDRAYINLPAAYNELKEHFHSLDLMELIKAVARANPFGDGDVQLYDTDTHMIYEGRTKKFIVKKAQTFLQGIPERFSPEENMVTFVSLRQLKRLINAFEEDKKHISCYSLIYLYVIYTLLYGKSSEADECLKYIKTLYIIVGNYFENNPDDQLAEFFYGCHEPICKAIESKNTALANYQLPPVPRNKPRDENYSSF